MSKGFNLQCLECGNIQTILDINDDEAIVNYGDNEGFLLNVDEDTFISELVCGVCKNKISW